MIKRGGPGRGQGRKPVKQGEETVTISLRMTTTQREKLARLGGDADSGDGWCYTNGGEIPCPQCNAESYAEYCREAKEESE